MRFMIMHKMTDEMERDFQPDPEIIAGVDKLIQEGLEEKVFVSGEGLAPSNQRLYIVYEGGKRTVTHGPFDDAKELPGGYALMRVRSLDEALSWCDRFAEVIGDIALFMGPVVEPWDLGMMEKPQNPPLRVLAMHQIDENAPETPPSAELNEKMMALVQEMTEKGVLQGTGSLARTQEGARIRFEGSKKTIFDGPFAESKELIAGYAILDLPSKEAAVAWAVRFGEVVQVNEVDVRVLHTA